MVKVDSLCKTFHDPKRGEIKAVDHVSFQAEPGRILGLLGVNGAGKTTTLRMLSTVISPGSGTASVGGFDVATQSTDVRSSIGFVSGSTALYGRLTGRECLEYFGRLYGMEGDKLRSAIDRVTERLQLHEFLNQLCDKLSTGQKQRVSVARAILADPPILFFDEPTAGLDVVSGQIILEFIEDAKARGKTVIFSTHIMSEAQRLCDHVLIIHEGKTRAHGTVASLMEQEQKPTFEAAFLSLVGYQRGTSNP